MAVKIKMDDGSELYHFGVKGQKWGIRKYQNEDGTLTDAGKKEIREIRSTIHSNSNREG